MGKAVQLDETMLVRPFPPEKVRIIGYSGFWIIVGTGVLLTRNFSGVDLDDNLLTRVFGYNNICVNFDFPPSTIVLPLLWALTLSGLLVYMASEIFVMKTQVQHGSLSAAWYRKLCFARVFEASTFVFFTTIFSVSPKNELEDPDHIYLMVHTAPFTLLQFGTTSLFLTCLVHDFVAGVPARLGVPTFMWTHVGFPILAMTWVCVIFKAIFQWNAMLKDIWFNKEALIQSGIPEVADKFYLFSAAILPLVYATILMAGYYDRLEKVVLSVHTFQGNSSPTTKSLEA